MSNFGGLTPWDLSFLVYSLAEIPWARSTARLYFVVLQERPSCSWITGTAAGDLYCSRPRRLLQYMGFRGFPGWGE